jgi:hypothetical protein
MIGGAVGVGLAMKIGGSVARMNGGGCRSGAWDFDAPVV